MRKYILKVIKEKRGASLNKSKEGFANRVIYIMISQGIIKIFGLLYSMYLINKHGFGDKGNAIYMGGYQVFILFLTVSSSSVPNIISKLISEKIAIKEYREANRVFKIALLCFGTIGFIETTILFFGAKWISNNFLMIPECEYSLIALAPSIFLSSILSVIRGFFNGVGDTSKTASSQVLEQVTKCLFTIIFVELIFNDNTIVMASVANFGTTCSIIITLMYMLKAFTYYKKIEKISISSYKMESNIKIVKKIFATSIPIIISTVLGTLNKNVDSITVVRILNPILGENIAKLKYGILSSKIDMLTVMPLSFNIAFSTVLIPEVSASIAKNNISEIKERLKFSLLITSLIAFPASIGISLYSDQILKLLFPNSSSGGELLKISAFCIIFMAFTQTIGGVLHGLGKTKSLIFASLVGLVIKIISNIIFIPITNLYEKGAVLGNLLSSISIFIISWNVLKTTLNLDFSINRIVIKPALASGIMAISSYIIHCYLISFRVDEKISMIFVIIFSIILYTFLTIIFKIIDKNCVKNLINSRKKSKIKKIHKNSKTVQ